MPTIAKLKMALERRLVELGQQVEEQEAEFNQPLERDLDEQANQIEDMDTAEGLEAVYVKEARQIKSALQRIADGQYGTCASCGEVIPDERLQAQPTATLCIKCAERLE